jgi:hypothetical protein
LNVEISGKLLDPEYPPEDGGKHLQEALRSVQLTLQSGFRWLPQYQALERVDWTREHHYEAIPLAFHAVAPEERAIVWRRNRYDLPPLGFSDGPLEFEIREGVAIVYVREDEEAPNRGQVAHYLGPHLLRAVRQTFFYGVGP